MKDVMTLFAKFKQLAITEKLIVIQVLVYILHALLSFLLQTKAIVGWFALPTSFSAFLQKPWTLFTYSFFHAGVFHLFFNMLLLYFSGRLFLNFLNKKQCVAVYILSVLSGGILFLISYNIFPVFLQTNTMLVGASAGVMGVLIAVCTLVPNQQVRLFFGVSIKLWQLGLVLVVLDLVQIPISNSGGHIAHIGGAVLGYFYIKQLQKGNDIGKGVTAFLDWIIPLCTGSRKKGVPFKKVYKNTTTKKKNNDTYSSTEQQQIDTILDKISKSGYESLSKAEKDFLFRAGK